MQHSCAGKVVVLRPSLWKRTRDATIGPSTATAQRIDVDVVDTPGAKTIFVGISENVSVNPSPQLIPAAVITRPKARVQCSITSRLAECRNEAGVPQENDEAS